MQRKRAWIVAIVLALTAGFNAGIASAAPEFSGQARIRDGGQLMIGKTKVRLGGLSAPALDQLCQREGDPRWTCGAAARDALIEKTRNKTWTCKPRQTDRQGRIIARCTVDGEDIHKWLVQNGWAIVNPRVTKDYVADERAARAANAGLWQGNFIAPWDWAVRNKRAMVLGNGPRQEGADKVLFASASDSAPPSPTCTIKGNVNRAGECIYHRPESRWYAKIKMGVQKGTRWFCSVEDAEAAGCRETRR